MMTVEELRDKLDAYIKRDPPDTWQLNDGEADAKAYKRRCEERAKREVIILDDGMQPKHFSILSAFGTTIYREDSTAFNGQDVFALCTDLMDPLK